MELQTAAPFMSMGKDGQRATIVINPGTPRAQQLASMVTDHPFR
jgi:hypothetical protein